MTAETLRRVTPMNGHEDCCCHSTNRKCRLGHPGKHNHFCDPDELDPHDAHCPGPACPGRCWEIESFRPESGAE